jgi:hypothetical protein
MADSQTLEVEGTPPELSTIGRPHLPHELHNTILEFHRRNYIIMKKNVATEHNLIMLYSGLSITNWLLISVKLNKVTFHRSGFRHFEESIITDNAERLNTFELLEVFLSSTLSMDAHVKFIISVFKWSFEKTQFT